MQTESTLIVNLTFFFSVVGNGRRMSLRIMKFTTNLAPLTLCFEGTTIIAARQAIVIEIWPQLIKHHVSAV